VVNARFDYLRAKAQLEALIGRNFDSTCQHEERMACCGRCPPGCGDRYRKSPAGVRHGREIVRALRGVDLTIRKNEFVAVMGRRLREIDADESHRLLDSRPPANTG